jgi:hypothetical protein
MSTGEWVVLWVLATAMLVALVIQFSSNKAGDDDE